MMDGFPQIWVSLIRIFSFIDNKKVKLTLAKLVATFIVMVWNFIGRKVLLEKKEGKAVKV